MTFKHAVENTERGRITVERTAVCATVSDREAGNKTIGFFPTMEIESTPFVLAIQDYIRWPIEGNKGNIVAAEVEVLVSWTFVCTIGNDNELAIGGRINAFLDVVKWMEKTSVFERIIGIITINKPNSLAVCSRSHCQKNNQ